MSAGGALERFEIVRRIGAGGMGVVYEAIDKERGARVALKTLRQLDPALLYRFKGEFRKLADITHENLVRLHELFAVDGDWFFTMELIEGAEPFLLRVDRARAAERSSPTLKLDEADLVEAPAPSRRGLDPERLRRAFTQLVCGVHALHRAGKLHRDLKPSNVLVAPDGRVAVCDFGLVVEPDGAGAFVTEEARLVGTAAYMSPEQAARRPLSPASDWYSVGVMLFEALVGHVPFSGAAADVLRRKQEVDAPRPSDLRRGVPEDLEQLAVRLLARDPATRPSAAEILTALGTTTSASSPEPRGSSPFIGRDADLAVLDEALERARAGASVVCLVIGASGLGKSAFLRRFGERAEDAGALVLRGRCFERESVSYKAFDSLIDALSAHLIAQPRGEADALVPRDVSALARLFPVLRRADAIAEAPTRRFDAPEPPENRRRAFGALRELMAAIAARRLLVLAVDDLQWGDVDSAALLSALIEPPGAPPLVFVGCCRAEDVTTSAFVRALLDRDAADLAVREIKLDPLGPDEARAFARRVLPAAGDEVAASIARESGGHPLFLEELARHAASGAIGADAAGKWPALDGMIRARIAALPVDARALLEVVAVAGRALPRGVAAAASELTAESAARAVDRLRDERLLRTGAGAHGDALEAWHDRIREVAVSPLDDAALRDRHARIAAALVAKGTADPEELALHLLAAGDKAKAREQSILAADRARDALAFDLAARLYNLAIELGDALGGAGETRALRRRLGDALANTGRGAESARAYLAALPGSDDVERLELRRRAAEQLLRSGHFAEGLGVLERVLDDVGLTLPTTPRGALATLVWRRTVRRLRGLGFTERAEADVAPAVLRRLDACWTAGVGLSMIDLVRGESFQTHHLLMALGAGEPYRIARALAMETVYVAGTGRFHGARVAALAARASELAARSGHAHARALAAVVRGIVAFLEGRWIEALGLFEAAEAVFRGECTGVAWELATTHYFEIGCLYYTGKLGELRALLPRLVAEAESRSDLYAATSLGMWPANVAWLAADDPGRARVEIDEASRRWRAEGFQLQHVHELFARAQIDLYEGEPARALARFEEHRSALERSLLLRSRNVAVSALHLEARAAIALAARGEAAGERLATATRAARAMRRTAMPWCAALASLVDAGIASAGGAAPHEAASRFDAAAEACKTAGLDLFAASASAQAAALARRNEARSAAEEMIRALGVDAPARMTRLLAPAASPLLR